MKCSTVTLTEHFKHEYGMSILEYATEEKLKLACEILSSTSRSIKEVGMACGFSDAEYFSRVFKKRYGKAPGKWRSEITK